MFNVIRHYFDAMSCWCREEESRKRVRELHRKIDEVKAEREREVKQRNEMIAHLKDQLQEMKAKTAMEGKYVKKVCDVSIAQTQKRCQLTEKTTNNEIEVRTYSSWFRTFVFHISTRNCLLICVSWVKITVAEYCIALFCIDVTRTVSEP